MQKSLFIEFLKGFALIVAKIYNKVNGKDGEESYLHKSLFTEEYSVDGKFSSVTGDTNRVTADVVTLDSSLPLKRLGSIKKVDGEIPKMGMKLVLNENRMKEWLILRSVGRITQLIDRIYDHVTTCIRGVEEMKEYLAFQAISTGRILVADPEKPGIGVRVDFNVSENNRFAPYRVWTDGASTPLDDIERMMERAEEQGYRPNTVWMDKGTSKLMLRNQSVKEFYGSYLDFKGTNIPVPNLSKLNEALSADQRPTISVIDRTVKFQRDGVNTVKSVWADGMVVLGTSGTLGTMAYTDLAEETFNANQATYAKAGTHILVSKFHKVDPIREYTASQAAVLPVLNDVDSLFYLNTKDNTTSASLQTEGDADIIIDGNTVTRDALITALKNVGLTKASERNTDHTLQKYFNDLEVDDEATVRTELGI